MRGPLWLRNLWSLQRLLRKRAIKGRASFCLLGKIPLRRKVPDLTHPLTQHSINTKSVRSSFEIDTSYNVESFILWTFYKVAQTSSSFEMGFGRYLKKLWMIWKTCLKKIVNILENTFKIVVKTLRNIWKFCECFGKYTLNNLGKDREIFWKCCECFMKYILKCYECFGKYIWKCGECFGNCLKIVLNILGNIWIFCECLEKGQEVLSYPAVSQLSNWSNIVHAQLANILIQCIWFSLSEVRDVKVVVNLIKV